MDGMHGKCHLWPCFAMGLEHVPKPGAVCGNRSAIKPPAPPPSPPPSPGPPAPEPTACPGLGAPIANFVVSSREECRSACDFSSGVSKVGCSTFEWSPNKDKKTPNCALYNGWPSYINPTEAARAGGCVCANLTGGFYPAPNPPPSGHSGYAVQDVWIPPGTWLNWDSGAVFTGPKTIVTTNTLEDIPAFVRNGAVIPLSSNETVHDIAPDPLRLVVAAAGGATSGEAEVYEDDGDSFDYQKGGCRLMRVNHTTANGATTLVVTPHAEGQGYAGERAQRTLEFEIRVGPTLPSVPKSVTANGVAVRGVAVSPPCVGVTCTYRGPALRVRATIAAKHMDSTWTLTVEY